MNCPTCGSDQNAVIDSRADAAGKSIRRRRKCLSCEMRFSTYEAVVTRRLLKALLAMGETEAEERRGRSWDRLSQKQRAERIAKMQAGLRAARVRNRHAA